jgi:hypothetical protein
MHVHLGNRAAIDFPETIAPRDFSKALPCGRASGRHFHRFRGFPQPQPSLQRSTAGEKRAETHPETRSSLVRENAGRTLVIVLVLEAIKPILLTTRIALGRFQPSLLECRGSAFTAAHPNFSRSGSYLLQNR